METNFKIIDRSQGVKHYATLSLQTILVYVVFIAGLFSVPAAKLIAEKISEMDIERGVLGETTITLDVADTDIKRIQGLSGVSSMPKKHGMLFIFDKPDYHGIWMKDMNFSLDILWLNEYSEVVYIEKKVSPKTFPNVFKPNSPAKYVIELNSGFVNENHIKIGDKFVLL